MKLMKSAEEIIKRDIPDEVRKVTANLLKEGFQAYLVGGCVRDLLRRATSGELVEPKDWDVATDATPEEIQKIFEDSVYENNFGTVGVKTNSDDPALKIVEVTTFRLEGKYTDKRHPDEVKFSKKIEDDLARRDFTINAIALSVDGKIMDPFGGEDDLNQGILKTVGDPHARFTEDALRLLRAARFATEFDFEIEFNTRRAIVDHAGLLEVIAKERIRDEFQKMLLSDRAAAGIILFEELDLLRYVLPEIRDGLGVGQNLHHIYTVFEHNVKALDYAAKQNYSLAVRLASLLHDVGKPKAKRGEGPNSTFYGHEIVGAKMTVKALEKLHFSNELIEEVAHLVRYHMFYYNVGEVSPAGVRRFLVRVGPEYVDDLIKLREADRIGSGVKKAVPYKLRHFLFMIDKVKHDPVSPKMLAVNGEDVMRELDIKPSPKVGWILGVLLEEVIDDPVRNERENLIARIKALGELPDEKLKQKAEEARKKAENFEMGIEKEMKEKHFVQ